MAGHRRPGTSWSKYGRLSRHSMMEFLRARKLNSELDPLSETEGSVGRPHGRRFACRARSLRPVTAVSGNKTGRRGLVDVEVYLCREVSRSNPRGWVNRTGIHGGSFSWDGVHEKTESVLTGGTRAGGADSAGTRRPSGTPLGPSVRATGLDERGGNTTARPDSTSAASAVSHTDHPLPTSISRRQ